jgi:Translationally controlled tumour protein
MKAVKVKLAETKPEEVDAFEKGAQAYAKKLIANFKDLEFVSIFHVSDMDTHAVY